MKVGALFTITFILLSCNKNKQAIIPISYNNTIIARDSLSNEQLKKWWLKDVSIDTIPGISLKRVYRELILPKEKEEVIIAILDNTFDISHKAISSKLWLNKNEIPNNNKDDDSNGYIDDVNGWNFLGNKDGELALFQSRGHIRVINKYEKLLKNSTSIEDTLTFKEYKNAKTRYTKDSLSAIEEKEYVKYIKDIFYKNRSAISKYFSNGIFSLESLDSLKLKFPNDSTLQRQILIYSNFIKYDNNEEQILNKEWGADKNIKYVLDLEYEERNIQGDDANNLTDKNYGNGILNWSLDRLKHGTKVANLATLPMHLNKDINTSLKLMPIVISSYGENHSKDIALAIRYAVDNGAKVINMSFTKEFSVNKKWLAEALKYAEAHDVLIIKAAGNDNDNTDNINYYDFPTDIDDLGNEVISNFITVGASTYQLNNQLGAYYSNYGKKNVDIFAPGDDIYVAIPKNKYKFDGGTSLATAITSGVAALLYSYYPKLTAKEVKQIILDSGVDYNIPVSVPLEDDENNTIPFNELSKSGKIVNAYNALLMAEEISKQKNNTY